jgi:2-polyprenyl-3-methyl-5-hydroxy-6-metoxy-1,4-benzoquinol methylase
MGGWKLKIESCRICKNKKLETILDLGEMPLANAFLDEDQLGPEEIFYPLRVVWCESCGLLQIDEIVPPEILFSNYVYVSGTSEALRKHFECLATEVVNDFSLNSESLVVDIGSNDGTLLKEFKNWGVQVIGVEPAVNIAKIAEENGIKTINYFFSEDTAKQIVKETGEVDVVTATNVVAHTNNLDDLLKGIAYLLKDEGVFVIEVPYLVDLLDKVEFDTIYHEHLSYFAVRPLKRLFEAHDFKIVNVERVTIHGGTIRVFVSKKKSSYEINESVSQLISLEIEKGLHEVTAYKKFAERVEKLKDALVSLLQKLKRENKKVIGYGAAAKGNTLLNYYRIGPDLMEFIADLSPMKQNKFTPGTHIPVSSPERIYDAEPDYMVILAWNFADEIMIQQAKFKEMGGQFIIPVPEVKIV